MPGVILCECAMQAGGVLLADQLDEGGGGSAGGDSDGSSAISPHGAAGRDRGDRSDFAGPVSQAFYLEARVRCEGKIAARLEFACTLAAQDA